MIIGFDASRAFVAQRTGTENYSYHLLTHLLQVDRKNAYKIYLRLPPEVVRTKESIKIWLSNVINGLPKTNNFRLILIRNRKFWTQIGLASELWRHPPNVLFIPAHTLPYIRRKSIKTVVAIHDLGYEYLPQYHQFPHRLWLNQSTEYAVKHARKLIAVSEATRDDLLSKLQAEEQKITVIYEGVGGKLDPATVSLTHIDQARTKYSVMDPFVLFVGTIQPRKNLVRLIQSFDLVLKDELVNSMYPKLKLVFIGKKGWLYAPIVEEPSRLGIEGRVEFLGHVSDSDTVALMKGAHCFAFPSLFEGFGLPILDSQAYGTPVVTSNKKPMTEVGGAACEYVDPLSIESIAQGIVHILTDRKYADSLRRKGLENVKRFSWAKAARETLRVLES